ncbi:hypothetical protein C1N71_13465 [Agrococcus sp. SGAir0287]|nr:hypothetical protein C1N71_13465 [Agrococcus sp. SGAir0287]
MGTPASSVGHSPEAERAYRASIAPPPRPPLPPEQLERARFAGGVGGAMLLLGADLVGLGVLLLLLPLVLDSVVRRLADVLPEVEPGVVADGVAQLYAGPWPWVAALLVVAGIALAAGGGLVSVRVLRAAGLAHPVRLTLAAFALALAGRIVLNIFTAPFSSLLSPLLERGIAGLAEGGLVAVGTVVGLLIACAMNVAIASATAMLAWWFVAHRMRPPAPEVEPEEPSWSSLLRHHHQPH